MFNVLGLCEDELDGNYLNVVHVCLCSFISKLLLTVNKN